MAASRRHKGNMAWRRLEELGKSPLRLSPFSNRSTASRHGKPVMDLAAPPAELGA